MTSTSPALRVECLLELARRVADPGDPLGREARARLAVTTGLAPEGVELALAHLEGRGDLPSLGLLLARAEPVARCWVVLSANVCTAALRALCFATACAPRVLVRPSRRDPVLAELLVREAANRGPFAVEAGAELGLVSQLAAEPGDLVHAYGSDETLGRLASTLPEGVSLRAHGTGLSVAVVGGGASLEAAAAALAADVVPFDQAGCLSPRIAFVEGDAARAAAFGSCLHDALERAARAVPRGEPGPVTRAELARAAATYASIGTCHVGASSLVAVDPLPVALSLLPPARAVLVVPADAESAPRLLAPIARFVTAVGAWGAPAVTAALAAACPFARCAPLGRLQHPPLDGPVDLRHAT